MDCFLVQSKGFRLPVSFPKLLHKSHLLDRLYHLEYLKFPLLLVPDLQIYLVKQFKLAKIEDDIETTEEEDEPLENASSDNTDDTDTSSNEDNKSDNKQDFGRY